MKKHFKIRVKGKVQGVFFRASAKQIADLLGVKGWVKNEGEEEVYLEAEGEEYSLQKFIEWCNHGPTKAKVKHVSVEDGEIKSFTAFEVVRTKKV